MSFVSNGRHGDVGLFYLKYFESNDYRIGLAFYLYF